MNTLPHTCSSAHSHTARWHAFFIPFFAPQHFSFKFRLCFRFVISYDGDRTPLSDSAIEKSLVRLPHCAPVQKHLHRVLLSFTHKGPHIHFLDKMYDAVVQQLAHRVVRQHLYTFAHVHHSDVGGQSGYDTRIACSTDYEPNDCLDESGNCTCVYQRWRQLGQAPSSLSLELHVLSNTTGRSGYSLQSSPKAKSE